MVIIREGSTYQDTYPSKLVGRDMGDGDMRECGKSILLRYHFGQKELLVQRPEGKEIQDTFRNSEG